MSFLLRGCHFGKKVENTKSSKSGKKKCLPWELNLVQNSSLSRPSYNINSNSNDMSTPMGIPLLEQQPAPNTYYVHGTVFIAPTHHARWVPPLHGSPLTIQVHFVLNASDCSCSTSSSDKPPLQPTLICLKAQVTYIRYIRDCILLKQDLVSTRIFEDCYRRITTVVIDHLDCLQLSMICSTALLRYGITSAYKSALQSSKDQAGLDDTFSIQPMGVNEGQ
jgi:hypothetical protein